MARSGAKKYRGSRTHGRGKKSGRGKGLRGGTGNAGLHKHKFMWTLKYDPYHFGRIGFKRPQKTLIRIGERKAINIDEVVRMVPAWTAAGKVSAKDGVPQVDLAALGYYKLLGRGGVATKVAITVPRAAEGAVRRVQAAGGTVTVTEPDEEEKPGHAAAKE